jgi:hypothetical protein
MLPDISRYSLWATHPLTLKYGNMYESDQEVVDPPCLRNFTFSGYWAKFILLRSPLPRDLVLKCPDSRFDMGHEVTDLPYLRNLTFSGYWARFVLLRAPLSRELNLEC